MFIPHADDARRKSIHNKQYGFSSVDYILLSQKVSAAINKAVENGELECTFHLEASHPVKLRKAVVEELKRKQYSVSFTHRPFSIYISWPERNRPQHGGVGIK